MTEYGALATTGAVLLLVAIICALIADESSDSQPYAGIAWTLFVAAAGCFIGSAWWAVIA